MPRRATAPRPARAPCSGATFAGQHADLEASVPPFTAPHPQCARRQAGCKRAPRSASPTSTFAPNLLHITVPARETRGGAPLFRRGGSNGCAISTAPAPPKWEGSSEACRPSGPFANSSVSRASPEPALLRKSPSAPSSSASSDSSSTPRASPPPRWLPPIHASGRRLAPRVRENGRVLLDSYRLIAAAIREERAITPAAEWLVDNFHIVEEQLREIRDDLPPRLLPEAPEARATALSRAIRASTASPGPSSRTPTAASIRRRCAASCSAYQRVQPLTIGELWAVASRCASSWSRTCAGSPSGSCRPGRRARRPTRSPTACSASDTHAPRSRPTTPARARTPSAVARAFAVQLVQRLRDQDPSADAGAAVARRRLAAQGTTPDEIVRDEHQRAGGDERDRAQRHHEHAADLRVRLGRVLREREPGRRRCSGRKQRLRGDGLHDPRPLPPRDRGAGATARAHTELEVARRRSTRTSDAGRSTRQSAALDAAGARSRLLADLDGRRACSSASSASGVRCARSLMRAYVAARRRATWRRSRRRRVDRRGAPAPAGARASAGADAALILLGLLALFPASDARDRARQPLRHRARRRRGCCPGSSCATACRPSSARSWSCRRC